jgi:hypothetical protein
VAPSGCGAVDRSIREKGDFPLTLLITGAAGVAINGPGLRIEGAPQKGPAIQEKPLGIAETLLKGGILLLGGLPLAFQGFEPLFQLHQTLGKQMERAGEILGATADPE